MVFQSANVVLFEITAKPTPTPMTVKFCGVSRIVSGCGRDRSEFLQRADFEDFVLLIKRPLLDIAKI